jgi:hypothetical protein
MSKIQPIIRIQENEKKSKKNRKILIFLAIENLSPQLGWLG